MRTTIQPSNQTRQIMMKSKATNKQGKLSQGNGKGKAQEHNLSRRSSRSGSGRGRQERTHLRRAARGRRRLHAGRGSRRDRHHPNHPKHHHLHRAAEGRHLLRAATAATRRRRWSALSRRSGSGRGRQERTHLRRAATPASADFLSFSAGVGFWSGSAEVRSWLCECWHSLWWENRNGCSS